MLTVDDVELADEKLSLANVQEQVRYMSTARYNFSDDTMLTYGQRPIDLDLVSLDNVRSADEATHTAKFIIRSYQWSTAFLKALPKLVVDPDWDGRYKHAGIDIYYPTNNLRKLYHLNREAVYRELADYVKPVQREGMGSYLLFEFAEPKYSTDHIGNPQVGILNRALWLQRRTYLNRLLSDKVNGYYSSHEANEFQVTPSSMGIHNLNAIREAFESASEYKPDASSVMSQRTYLLEEQGTRQNRIDRLNRQQATERFSKFWQTLKAAIPQDSDDAYDSWDTIPLAESGTSASRTWGIEIETVRAGVLSRPMGWERVSDGSLPDSGCNCDCDYCYDGDHCDEDSCISDAAEFVSPILNDYNSRGLRALCDGLGTDEDEDSAPGIHVHVGGDDLSVADVTRLLLSYSIVEKLFEPIYRRQTRNYCRPTTVDTLRWWLQKVREYRNVHPDQQPRPRDLVYESPADRYSDVNLHALAKHGTIEFRAMGAWYDYDYLVRWAWLVREMVNVSKLGIAQREWTACKTLDDVIALLRKYGSEMPSNQLFADKSPERVEMLSTER